MHTERTLADDDARKALDAMASECVSTGLKAVLAVADSDGELIGLLRLAAAPLA